MSHDVYKKRNPYADNARLAKRDKLVNTIDAAARGAKASDKATLYFVENMTDAEWASAALIAGVRPPSATTRAMVVAIYRYRRS